MSKKYKIYKRKFSLTLLSGDFANISHGLVATIFDESEVPF